MKLHLAFAAALGLSALSFAAVPTAEVHAQDTNPFNDKFQITVSRGDGKLKIRIEGKMVGSDQWYVNRDYPINLKLAAGAATLGKKELTKDDATFEGTQVAGKALAANFATTISGADKATVNYKIVVCSASSCSPPIKGEVKEP